MDEQNAYEGWAVVELMGHRRLAGRVSTAAIGGASLLRLDVPKADGQQDATQFYGPQAIYCITPVSEEIARHLAKGSVRPVSRYEMLPEPTDERCVPCRTEAEHEDEDDDDDAATDGVPQ